MVHFSTEPLHLTYFIFLTRWIVPSTFLLNIHLLFACLFGSSTMQYVILTYMKHLGVKVKEPRNLEQKRGRIGFLPKIKVVVL